MFTFLSSITCYIFSGPKDCISFWNCFVSYTFLTDLTAGPFQVANRLWRYSGASGFPSVPFFWAALSWGPGPGAPLDCSPAGPGAELSFWPRAPPPRDSLHVSPVLVFLVPVLCLGIVCIFLLLLVRTSSSSCLRKTVRSWTSTVYPHSLLVAWLGTQF